MGATVRAAAAAIVAGLALAACGGGHSQSTPTTVQSETALLARSRTVVDAATAVHFVLASTGVSSSGTAITAGTGDLIRPDSLQGDFSVQVGGFAATVGVVETGGRFYAKPPFQSSYSVTNPASYGLGDPAQLLSPTNGVSALLTSMTGVHAEGQVRLAGELLDVVAGQIPGTKVPVLPNQAPSRPVSLVASIDPATGQLRRVQLSGPFTSATVTTTYTVTLTDYGEHKSIVAPPT